MVRPIRNPSHPAERPRPRDPVLLGALEADGAGEGVSGKHAARILDVGPSLVARPGACRSGPGRAGDCERETRGVRRERSGDRQTVLELEARRSALRRRNHDDRSPHRGGLPGEPSAIWASASARAAIFRAHGSGSPTGKSALNFSARKARLASDQRHAQLRLCGRSGAAGASFDGGRLRPADRVSPQRQTRAELASFGTRSSRCAP